MIPLTEQPPTLPIIHLNGTSAKDLFEGYVEAQRAVNDALDAIRKIEFNARDYYPVDGLWLKAKEEMLARTDALRQIRDELLAIAMHCQDHIKE